MRKDWQTLELCDRFFDAIEQNDYETLESCYAPEAIIWHSHDCLYQPRADNLAMLKQGMETLPKTRFKDRRIRVFEGGFVQQHTIYVTRDERLRRPHGRLLRRLRPRRDDQPRVRVLRHRPDREVPRARQNRRRDGDRNADDVPAEGLVERVRAISPLIADDIVRGRGAAPPARRGDRGARRRPACSARSCRLAYGGYEIDMRDLRRHRHRGGARRSVDGLDHHLLHGAQLAAHACSPRSSQDEIFGAQPFVLAPGTVNPSGRATPTADGTLLAVGASGSSPPASATPTGCC